MKVGRTSSASSAGRSRTASTPTGFAISSEAESQAPSAPSVVPAAPVSSVDAIMALQRTDDRDAQEARAARRGRRMIGALDQIHLAVLSGHVSTDHQRLLQSATDSPREDVSDSALKPILDAIEVRAAVELEKLKLAQTK